MKKFTPINWKDINPLWLFEKCETLNTSFRIAIRYFNKKSLTFRCGVQIMAIIECLPNYVYSADNPYVDLDGYKIKLVRDHKMNPTSIICRGFGKNVDIIKGL